MMITNCRELAKLHFNFSPTIETAHNHPAVNSREHYRAQCSGIGYVNHYWGLKNQQIEKKFKTYSINWNRGEKTGSIDSFFDLYGNDFALVNAQKNCL